MLFILLLYMYCHFFLPFQEYRTTDVYKTVWKQAVIPKKWRENFPAIINCIVIHGLDVDPSHLLNL